MSSANTMTSVVFWHCMLICCCIQSIVWFPYFRWFLIAVRIASCLFLAEFQFSTIHILNWARDALMRFTPYSNDHITYLCIYVQTKFFILFYGTIIWWDFFLSPTSLFDSFVAPPNNPPPFLRLKCEDDHGTCHGQWFCEPCRLRLGRGSVSRMLLLPCTNKAITSKMKARRFFLCVCIIAIRSDVFFPASSILVDWFALSKFKHTDGQLKGSENCIIFVVKTVPFRCTCTTNTHTHTLMTHTHTQTPYRNPYTHWHMFQIYCCNCNIS